MFNANDRIKLNSEIFPADKLDNKTFQAGALNYPVLCLDWELQVIDSFTDSYHGIMLKCNVLNDPRVDPTVEVYFRAADSVLSKAIKLKIEYNVLKTMLKVQPLIDANRNDRALVMKERDKLRKKFSLKTKEMRDNWKKVKDLDVALEKLKADTSSVFVISTPALGTIELDCKEDQIENKIRSLIRQKRAALKKIDTETKIIAGDISYKKIGNVFSESGQIAKLSKDFAIKVINAPKKPVKAEENYVGIELECFSSKTRDEMRTAFIKAGLKSVVNVGEDGSISPVGKRKNAMEIRVCISEKDLPTLLPRVMQVIDDNDCDVNNSCGTHVHLDMRNRNPELAYFNLFKTQNLMLAIQPLARRTNNYCVPNTNPEEKLEKFGQSARRSAINTTAYPKHKTIEIRLHHGTIDYSTLKNWINFLVSVVSLPTKLGKAIDTVADLDAAKLVDSEVITSFKARVKKYA